MPVGPNVTVGSTTGGIEVVSPVETVLVETGKPEGRGVRMSKIPGRGDRRPLWVEDPGRAEGPRKAEDTIWSEGSCGRVEDLADPAEGRARRG